MAYTLCDAIDSLEEYRGLNDTAFTAAVMKLQSAAVEGPRKLRSEAARIRGAFYVYADAVNYGRP